jgi:fibro-slime domain-containing protein
LGNLNDNQSATCFSNGLNPRCMVLPGTFDPGAPVRVDAKSWRLEGSDGCDSSSWNSSMTASTDQDTVQLSVLRNGDLVPNIPALYSQDSIEEYVGDFIDLDTGTMRLADNQVIYLWELGTSGGSSSADFQDLVLLVTLARDSTGLCGAVPEPGEGTVCGSALGDAAGEATPAGDIDSSGGVTSEETFSQWFQATMGLNTTAVKTLTLVDDGTGVFEFQSAAFHPVDGEGLGNEGRAHNDFFTLEFQADFTYEQCLGQFIEFEGNDDAWLFVDGQLVMDLGGMQAGVRQYVDMDRLLLTDGARVRVNFFHASRQDTVNSFHLRTNIRLETSGQALLSHAFD